MMSLVPALPQNNTTSFIFVCERNKYIVFVVMMEIGNSAS